MLKVFKLPSSGRKRKPDKGSSEPDASSHAHAASSHLPADVTPSVAPVLDLKLPSPSFSNHFQQNPSSLHDTPSKASLWVDVSASPPASLFQNPNELTDPSPRSTSLTRSATQSRRLKVRLSSADVASLVRDCTAQLKSRGLEELGLFRPYRWAEDMSRQRRLQNLFLKSIETELLAPSEHSNGEDPAQDLLSATHKPAELLAEELQCAGVHDLSALIRWALRHLCYGIAEPQTSCVDNPFRELESSFPSSGEPPEHAYATFTQRLSEPDSKLLTALMELVASVAAYAESNAMSASRLCKTIGFWVLSPRTLTFADYKHFYHIWVQSARLFEHMFLAYLRDQPTLTRRLQEVLDNGAPTLSNQRALQAVYSFPTETKPSSAQSEAQKNFSTDSRFGQRAKSCAALLNNALTSVKSADSAVENTEAITEEWWHILTSKAKQATPGHDQYRQVISEDTQRIIALVDPAPSKIASSSPSLGSPTRRRSLTVDSSSVNGPAPHLIEPAIGLPNLPKQSYRALLKPATSDFDTESSRPPTWSDFVSTGFDLNHGAPTEDLTLTLQDPKKPEESAQPTKLHKNAKTVSRQQQQQQVPKAKAGTSAPEEKAPLEAQLELVCLVDLEDVFADMYLDVIGESEIRAKWPDFAIAQLRTPLGEHRSDQSIVKWLVVEEVASKARPSSTPPGELPITVERAASSSRSSASARDKRPFFARISAVLNEREGKKTSSTSPHKGKKKTSTPPNPKPALDSTPRSPQQDNSEHTQSANATSLDKLLPTQGRPISKNSSQSSLGSIKRVSPPSVDPFLLPSVQTPTEVSSTRAVRQLSPGVSIVHIDATETLHNNCEPSEKLVSEVETDAPVAFNAAEAPPVAEDSMALASADSADVPAKPPQESEKHQETTQEVPEPLESAQEVEADKEITEKEPTTLAAVANSTAQLFKAQGYEAAGFDEEVRERSAHEESDSEAQEPIAPTINVSSPHVLQIAAPEQPQPATTPELPDIGTALEHQKSNAESMEDENQLAKKETAERTSSPVKDSPMNVEERPQRQPTPTIDAPLVKTQEHETLERLSIQDTNCARRSPSAESFASKTSRASDTPKVDNKSPKKFIQGAKKMMNSPFRKNRKSSASDAGESVVSGSLNSYENTRETPSGTRDDPEESMSGALPEFGSVDLHKSVESQQPVPEVKPAQEESVAPQKVDSMPKEAANPIQSAHTVDPEISKVENGDIPLAPVELLPLDATKDKTRDVFNLHPPPERDVVDVSPQDLAFIAKETDNSAVQAVGTTKELSTLQHQNTLGAEVAGPSGVDVSSPMAEGEGTNMANGAVPKAPSSASDLLQEVMHQASSASLQPSAADDQAKKNSGTTALETVLSVPRASSAQLDEEPGASSKDEALGVQTLSSASPTKTSKKGDLVTNEEPQEPLYIIEPQIPQPEQGLPHTEPQSLAISAFVTPATTHDGLEGSQQEPDLTALKPSENPSET